MALWRICGWFFLLGLLLPLPIAQAAESRLVQPLENSILRHREIQIIALIEGGLPLDVSLSVDDKTLTFRLDKAAQPGIATSLHAVTTVTGYGVHRITITAKGKGGDPRLGTQKVLNWRKSIEFFVADPLIKSVPKQFSAKSFHNEAGQKGCAGSSCHEFKLEKNVTVAANTGCRTCHRRESEFRHAPVRLGACAECHTAGTSGFAPRASAEEACFGCHKDMKEAIETAKFVHGPTQKIECTLCHDPHGERKHMMTWRGKNGTCVTCHDGYDKQVHVMSSFTRGGGHPLNAVPDPLNSDDEMSCGSCHNPHYAAAQYLYIGMKSERTELCEACHENKF